MYNRVTIRKIPRTEGPTYPTRAVQTVDLTVAKWIPATVALLACFVTPARATLDARYYAQPTYPHAAAQLINAGAAVLSPVFETEHRTFCTPARPSLDVRQYEWSAAFVSIPRLTDPTVAQWEPAFSTELASECVRSRRTLDVRQYEWDVNESAWIRTVVNAAPTVAQTAPAWTDDGARTAARLPLDVRSYDWAPEPGPWIAEAADAAIQTWMPAVETERASSRTIAASTDVRVTQPGYTNSLTSAPTTAQTAPAWTNQESSDRTAASGFSVRPTESLFTSAVTLPAGGPTTAQTAPAWANASCNFRTPDDPTPFDVFRTTCEPNTSGVPDDWVLWVPAFQLQASSFRTPASSADVRLTAPSFLSSITIPAASVAQTAPAWTGPAQTFRTGARACGDPSRADSGPNSFRTPDDWITWVPLQSTGGLTPDRARLEVRGYEWSSVAWITATLPVVTVTPAQQLPALLEASGLSYRTPARPVLDVRSYDWSPAFSWVQPVADAATARLAAIFGAELTTYRTADGPRLDVRSFEWLPEPAWIFTSLPPAVTTAQTWPAVLEGLSPSYRTASGALLDVRTYDWAPGFSWVQPVVDGSVRTWIPVFDAELASTRTPARRQDPIVTEPQPAWIVASLPQDASPAQQVGAWLEAIGLSYRTGERPRLDVRAYDWAPTFAWVQPVLDATVRTWIPAFDAALASCRTPAQAQAPIGTEPQPAFIVASLPPDAAVNQRIPALIQAAGLSFRTAARATTDVRRDDWSPAFGWIAVPTDAVIAKWTSIVGAALQTFRTTDRARLDVRGYDWSPEGGWLPTTVAVIVAKWLPVWAAEVGGRTPDDPSLNVRDLTSAPELAWLAGLTPSILGISVLHADVVVLIAADDTVLHVPADDEALRVRADDDTIRVPGQVKS